jgi:putative FmdB family regulatory protein
MPVFEFRCAACGRKFEALVGMTADQAELACPKCGSREATKLVSRFARVRSEDDRVDSLADRLESMAEPDDPGQMRQLVREMGKAMDEDLSDEMEEMYEADLEGKLPDDPEDAL